MADKFAQTGVEYYKQGIGAVSAYQVSTIPYLTSSLTIPNNTETPLKVQFGYISAWFGVRCSGSNVRVGVSVNGVAATDPTKVNYIVINAGEYFQADWKVNALYLLSDGPLGTTGSVVAGLTSIEPFGGFENWTGSVGVG